MKTPKNINLKKKKNNKRISNFFKSAFEKQKQINITKSKDNNVSHYYKRKKLKPLP